MKQIDIANLTGRHTSTISRELRRNSSLRGYRPWHAQALADKRRACNARRIESATWAQVHCLLLKQWSPEQISSHVPISPETIYRYVYTDKRSGGALWKNLRCQKKRKKRYGSGRERRGQILNRRPIHMRPKSVETRLRVGHWECDTVIGVSHKQAIVSMVERKSGYAVLKKVSRKTSEAVGNAIITGLTPLKQRVHTLTYDNGKEFTGHAHIDRALDSTGYFADPFSSWQRGSVENLNGLLRQYIPKNRPLSTVTDEELAMIERSLNSRPRKRLGFKTPLQVFHESLKRVALRM